MNVLRYMKYFEPARLRALYVAVLGLLAVFGVHLSADLDTRITELLAALAIIIPIIQGEWTRWSVNSPATLDAAKVNADMALPAGHAAGFAPATDDHYGSLVEEQAAYEVAPMTDPNYNPANDSRDGNEPLAPGTPGAI